MYCTAVEYDQSIFPNLNMYFFLIKIIKIKVHVQCQVVYSTL
jgi:hypothetical protein